MKTSKKYACTIDPTSIVRARLLFTFLSRKALSHCLSRLKILRFNTWTGALAMTRSSIRAYDTRVPQVGMTESDDMGSLRPKIYCFGPIQFNLLNYSAILVLRRDGFLWFCKRLLAFQPFSTQRRVESGELRHDVNKYSRLAICLSLIRNDVHWFRN